MRCEDNGTENDKARAAPDGGPERGFPVERERLLVDRINEVVCLGLIHPARYEDAHDLVLVLRLRQQFTDFDHRAVHFSEGHNVSPGSIVHSGSRAFILRWRGLVEKKSAGGARPVPGRSA